MVFSGVSNPKPASQITYTLSRHPQIRFPCFPFNADHKQLEALENRVLARDRIRVWIRVKLRVRVTAIGHRPRVATYNNCDLLQAASSGLLGRVTELIKDVLRDWDEKWKLLAAVEVIGGGSCVPMVQSYILKVEEYRRR